MKQPTTFTVDVHARMNPTTVCLAWRTSEARYHVWVDHNLEPTTSDGVGRRALCFKNPLVDRHQPGHFETRRLWLNSKPTAAMFASAQRIARDEKLVEAFLLQENREACARAEAGRNETRLHRIKEAGPELLEALLGFVAQYDSDRRTWPNDMVALLDRATAAIAKAEGMR